MRLVVAQTAAAAMYNSLLLHMHTSTGTGSTTSSIKVNQLLLFTMVDVALVALVAVMLCSVAYLRLAFQAARLQTNRPPITEQKATPVAGTSRPSIDGPPLPPPPPAVQHITTVFKSSIVRYTTSQQPAL
jgi:hypothetical protein